MSRLGYSVGDKVYAFNRNGFYTGTVQAVTPSGQVNVLLNGAITVRYTAAGRKVGSSSYTSEYILPKHQQEERAEGIRQHVARTTAQNNYRGLVDKMRALSVEGNADAIREHIAQINAILEKQA